MFSMNTDRLISGTEIYKNSEEEELNASIALFGSLRCSKTPIKEHTLDFESFTFANQLFFVVYLKKFKALLCSTDMASFLYFIASSIKSFEMSKPVQDIPFASPALTRCPPPHP